ncbi:heterodimeric methylmalonyl-CoA mutase small subunit [Rhizobium sp. ERR 922]|uniref:methylmalonyl-CoA mutase family protein n=1 Tax=unclassified Rhizobium TaxID=2613769 RepID=UPI0011A02E55|nr:MULTISPECIES: methylmalonyl-CoA mutase family protein [unclassified Rhizobium]TWB55359.1 heterodimeric methylmalonyl-CoA mutase small subunit [Rhizobium sp. ERR 922]TWB97306.1 heterodimeric methylmalonyl-CoA mutase small subunit [Rhizobium sp. ERR 942]
MNIDSLDPGIFGQTDHKIWLKLVERALKGKNFQEALVSRTDDGIAIEPLYQRRRDGKPLFRQRAELPWMVMQRMDDPDTERAMVQLGDDLANGASGISLVSSSSASAFGIGMDAQSPIFSEVLAAASAKTTTLRLDGFSSGVAKMVADGGAQRLHLGLDAFLTAGHFVNFTSDIKYFKELKSVDTIVNADGRAVHNAGGTEAQELAVMAASLVGHLRLLEEAGLSPEAALAAISLCLSANQNQFITNAKMRAARLIFTRIAEACGITDPRPAHLFAETSYRMLTRLDPETNILRNTIAVFSAGVGGADEIGVLPHSLTHGIPDPLARRLARNTQTILIAESHLDHVADPAAGAGGIEALTDALCERAWEIFTRIEGKGGLAKVISSGELAAMIAEARESRAARPIVGTTLFAMKTERPVTVLGPLGPIVGGMGLVPIRLDEGVEA